jgi:hypothetical protein
MDTCFGSAGDSSSQSRTTEVLRRSEPITRSLGNCYLPCRLIYLLELLPFRHATGLVQLWETGLAGRKNAKPSSLRPTSLEKVTQEVASHIGEIPRRAIQDR